MDANPEQHRVVGRPFQPGQSGNPSGRPKGVAFGALLNRLLDDVRKGSTDRERIAKKFISMALEGDLEAAKWVIERADGKVKDVRDDNLTGEVVVRVLRDRAGGVAPLPTAPVPGNDPPAG